VTQQFLGRLVHTLGLVLGQFEFGTVAGHRHPDNANVVVIVSVRCRYA